MNIYFDEAQVVSEEILKKMEDAAVYAAELEDLDEERCEISVTFVDMDEIHELNKIHRGVDRPTDVLSFPQVEYTAPADFSWAEEHEVDCFHPDTGELQLGDIIISLDKVREQAEKYNHGLKREYAFLIAHSMLHLMGYDHERGESDEQDMRRRQRDIMKILGLEVSSED